MVETKNPEEPTLPSKRKPDVRCGENDGELQNKAQKLRSLNNNSQISGDKTQDPEKECVNSEAQVEKNDDVDDVDAVDDDEHEDAGGNGEVVVDRKGKGILIEDEEDDESDEDGDDDSSDGGSQSDGDSDLSDDPLTEVDLDNILPSRTRRRTIQPGEFVANNLSDDDDDNDSDDDDA